jgi:hypothetical protein
MKAITTYNQLIEIIRDNNLNVEQATELINKSLSVLIIQKYSTTDELLKVVDEFWNKWKNYKGEKPIFLDVDLNVID